MTADDRSILKHVEIQAWLRLATQKICGLCQIMPDQSRTTKDGRSEAAEFILVAHGARQPWAVWIFGRHCQLASLNFLAPFPGANAAKSRIMHNIAQLLGVSGISFRLQFHCPIST